MIDKARMEKVAKPFETKSDKIRALSAAGYERTEIAKFLDIRYQHVRNVLVQSERKKNGELSGSDAAREGIRNRMRLKVDTAGRILIPSAVRDAMGVGEDGTVLAWLEKGELRLVSAKVALRLAQELARELGVGRGLADELIADRREEAQRENADG
jgi:bifunctional DNA-binding transcriptional regulator/antitoxin component of YhaV-PrlF toxin-antitoxin module